MSFESLRLNEIERSFNVFLPYKTDFSLNMLIDKILPKFSELTKQPLGYRHFLCDFHIIYYIGLRHWADGIIEIMTRVKRVL